MIFMKVLKLGESLKKDSEVLDKASRILKNGGVILYPTETLYGLGANALDEVAVSKIFKIKKRDINKPLSVLVRDMQMAKKIACIDSKAELILNKIWPGPVTIVLRKKDLLPYVVTAGGETVAVRISSNLFVQSLMSRLDFPIISTSANFSGEDNLISSQEIGSIFSHSEYSPDIFIDAGDLNSDKPSAIIDLTDIKNPRIVRMGFMTGEDFNDFLKNFSN
jgi:L-threonylcarbamoyladenylate synthase